MEPRAYDEMRALEDHHWWFRGRRTVVGPQVEEALGPDAPGTLLDIGCGTGANLAYLAQLGPRWRILGLDLDPRALRHANGRALDSQLLCGTGMHLPIQDQALQCVTAFDVIEHVRDDRGLLREIHRVLCPGGRLVATVPAYPALHSPHDDALHHFRRYRTGELEALLQETGFEVVRRHGFNFVLLPAIAGVRWVKTALGRLRNRNGEPGSTDFFQLPAALNAMMLRVFEFERWLVGRVPVVFGTSFVIRARKR